MRFEWNPVKSERLKKIRGFGFEEIVQFRLVDIRNHPFRQEQELMLFEVENYIWVVPFVRGEQKMFLKTLYPDRRYTEKFRRGEL